MASTDVIIPTFLKIIPEFKGAWEEYLTDWDNESQGIYLDMATLARFIVNQYENKKIEKFPLFFEQVERFLNTDDEELKGVISFGLLEDIQTIASNREFGYDVFLPWLGSSSKDVWFQIEAMWAGKTSLMDVIRSEVKSNENN